MEAEFRQIKEQVSGSAFIVNEIKVYDHDPRFVREHSHDSHSSKCSEVSLLQGGKGEYLEPYVIEKITVNQRKKHSDQKRSRSNSSEHSYKIYMHGCCLWEGKFTVKNVVFHVKLLRNDFLDYKLTAHSEQTGLQHKNITYLPFEEEDAQTETESCLILDHNNLAITALDLKKKETSNPVYRKSHSKRGAYDQDSLNSRYLYMFNIDRFSKAYHVEIT